MNTYRFVIGAYSKGENGLHLIQVSENSVSLSKIYKTNESVAYLCDGNEKDTFYGCIEELDTAKIYEFLLCNDNDAKVTKELKMDGSALCHISLINDKIYGSCYMSGNMFVCDSSLDKLEEVVFDSGKSSKSHYHSTCVSQCGHYILCADLGKDSIYVFSNDSQEKLLYAIDLPSGSGPRDIVFFSGINGFCVSLEISNQFAVFMMNDCTLKYELKNIYCLHEKNINNSPSNLCLTMNDDYMFIANRGENTISIYSIDKLKGFTKVIETGCFGNWPRHIMLSKDNRKLICCNRRSNNVVLFDVDLSSRTILEKIAEFDITTPSCAIEM